MWRLLRYFWRRSESDDSQIWVTTRLTFSKKSTEKFMPD